MHKPAVDLFADVLEYLEHLATERLHPDQALDRLQAVRAKHSDASVDLVWDEEAFDGSFHYDALVRPANAGKTMSLSVCPDGELPWVLRGLQRWRDSELLRVNNVTLSVEQAITQLDVLWNSPGLMQRLIDHCIVEGELQRRDLQVSTAEIQQALNGLRRQRGLLTAAALQAWMESAGVTRATLQELATKLALRAKLRESIAAPRMKVPADSQLRQLDEIKVAVLEVGSEADAVYAAEVVRAGQMRLPEVAQELFLRASSNGQVQITLREDARHALAAQLEGCELAAGAVHVQAVGDGYRVVHVLGVKPADAGSQMTQRLKAKLFDDWLAEQRRAARIEWFWGDARHTAQEKALN